MAISAVSGLAVLAIVLIGTVCGVALLDAAPPLAMAIGAVTFVAVVGTIIVSDALSQIFRVAVFRYAVTGETPIAFDAALIQTAFAGDARRT